MPRHVRNFWIDLDVDGRTPIGTGPKGKDDGFCMNVFIRDNGSVKKAVAINGRAINNSLEISIHTADGAYLTINTNK